MAGQLASETGSIFGYRIYIIFDKLNNLLSICNKQSLSLLFGQFLEPKCVDSVLLLDLLKNLLSLHLNFFSIGLSYFLITQLFCDFAAPAIRSPTARVLKALFSPKIFTKRNHLLQQSFAGVLLFHHIEPLIQNGVLSSIDDLHMFGQ